MSYICLMIFLFFIIFSLVSSYAVGNLEAAKTTQSVSTGKINNIQTSPSEYRDTKITKSDPVGSLINHTGVATLVGKIVVNKLHAITLGIYDKDRSTGLHDNVLPENSVNYALAKNQSHFIKSHTKVFAIRPPTPTSNISSTPASNTSAVNSSGISHNQLVFGRNITGFPGLNYTNTCDGCLPPDVQIAVGPTMVTQMVNGAVGFWTKQGHLIRINDLDSFFNLSSSELIADPNILFDSASHRWFSSVLDTNTSSVRVAVSTGDDPSTGTWLIFNFPSNSCPDRPAMAVSSDKFVVSFNDYRRINGQCPYNGGQVQFANVEYIVADKNTMIKGTAIPKFKAFEDDESFSLFPVRLLDQGSTLFLVSVGSESNPTVQVVSIDGQTPDNLTIHNVFQNIQTTNTPPSALQPGSGIVLDTADARVLDAAFHQGKIWLAFNDRCSRSNDMSPRTCIRLIQLNVNSNLVLQDSDVGFNSSYYMYPALTIDNEGNLLMVFAYSSPSIFPSIAILEHSADTRVNTYNVLLKAGIVPNLQGDKMTSNGYIYERCEPSNPDVKCVRYGDYFGASRDPSDSSVVWLSGEYYVGQTFSTFIAKLSGRSMPNS